jgi:4-hydroxy-3-polyprenylbenzoate decarboxylase
MTFSNPAGRRLVVSVTGASGAIYAVRFLKHVAPLCERVDLIFSSNASSVAETELGLKLSNPVKVAEYLGVDYPAIHVLASKDYFTPPASGSYLHDGMVIIPCSMGTVGRIANGISDDLTSRAADVCLKERRRLILVPRETPFNLIHLRNLATITEAGGLIIPASPAFYHKPQTIEDLVDTVVSRVVQHLGMTQNITPAWQVDRKT